MSVAISGYIYVEKEKTLIKKYKSAIEKNKNKLKEKFAPELCSPMT